MRLEVAFELVLLVVFVALYSLATAYPERSRQFPQLIALVTIALLLLALGRNFARSFTTAASTRRDRWDRERAARVARAWGVIVVATACGAVGGFLISVVLFFLGFAFFFGTRQAFWRHAAIGVGISAVIWILFDQIMGVPLLAGVLW